MTTATLTRERRATGRLGGFTAEAGVQVGEKFRWRIKVIEGDIVGSSAFYPYDVLERDLPAALPIGSHVYIDHPSYDEEWNQPERTLTKLAGTVASGITADPTTKSFYAEVDFSREAHEKILLPFYEHIGASIYMLIESTIGTIGEYTGNVATNLIPDVLNGVDLVTHAGAKGAIISQVTESFRSLASTETKPPVDTQRVHENRENHMDEEKVAKLVAEAVATALAAHREAEAKAAKEASDKAAAEAVNTTEDVTELAIAEGIEAPESRAAIRESVARGMDPKKAIENEKAREAAIVKSLEAKRGKESFGSFDGSTDVTDWTVSGVTL